MKVKKWAFKGFDKNITNLNFLKQLPFCTFSDLKDPKYDLIGKVLDTLAFDRNKFINIGKKEGPFGINLYPDNEKDYNILLNSCQFSFILTTDIEETSYLIQSVLAGIVPICNLNHVYIKSLGLSSYATLPDQYNILDKIGSFIYHQHIYHHKIYWLSWKYNNQVKKWRKTNSK